MRKTQHESRMIKFDTAANGAVPFWFWNGNQQEAEISRQLQLASEAGLRGMVIHARRGNRTEYLSERWLALVAHACKEARRLGLEIWLYDEEGFPSGTVGNRLQRDNPYYQQKHLRFGYMTCAEALSEHGLVAAFDAAALERVDPCEMRPDQPVLVFLLRRTARYVDTLKRETAERFIRMTHEPYFAALQPFFGNPITCVYTDDLNSNLDRGPSLAYTERLPQIFEARMGYPFLENLPKLVENVPDCERVRLDYRRVVMDLFLNEFVEPMHEWAEQHGVLFTGHLSGDEGEIEKAAHAFGAAMPFYEHEHIPGIDDFLCSSPDGAYLDHLRNPQNHSLTILVKQASSVGNQLKAGRCGCECLTFLGWGASVRGQSALLNVELALGVNLFTHHDFSYATGGVAKDDCPPSYFFQQPYWASYRHVLDATAHSAQLLQRGRYDADLLVLHPISSCWAVMDGDQLSIREPFEVRTPSMWPRARAFEESLAAISHELLKMQVGFEYGDEWLLEKHGRMDGSGLMVGTMTYQAVLIPMVCNLQQSTVRLLEAFQAAGGRLLAIDPDPNCMVDGDLPGRRVFGERLQPETLGSVEALQSCGLTPSIELITARRDAFVVHSRVLRGGKEHYVLNASTQPQVVSWRGDFMVYDPATTCCVEEDAAPWCLPPQQGLHLLSEQPEGVPAVPKAETLFAAEVAGGYRAIPAASWRVITDQPNLMLIDWCKRASGAFAFHKRKAAEEACEALRTIDVDIPDPSRVKALVCEPHAAGGITLNGKALAEPTGSHPASQDLICHDVSGLLVAGKNTLSLPGQSAGNLFEPFYLAGNVGVGLEATENGMMPVFQDANPGLGNLVTRGYPFYWGRVVYTACVMLTGGASFSRLDCGEVDGVLKVKVNGSDAGVRYAPPYRFFIADKLTPGENRLELELSNTAQNLFGPHRHLLRDATDACDRYGTGDGSYYLARFGISGPVVLC